MGFFELGKMTIGSMFKKPETILYPFETKPAPVGRKGMVHNDSGKCILCGKCERVCPTGSITVDRTERTWSINHYSCIMCSMCVRNCPVKSLTMETGWPQVTRLKTDEVQYVADKKKAAKKPAADAKPAAKAEAKAEAKPAEKPAAEAKPAAEEKPADDKPEAPTE